MIPNPVGNHQPPAAADAAPHRANTAKLRLRIDFDSGQGWPNAPFCLVWAMRSVPAVPSAETAGHDQPFGVPLLFPRLSSP
jgi:hypothetical protein